MGALFFPQDLERSAAYNILEELYRLLGSEKDQPLGAAEFFFFGTWETQARGGSLLLFFLLFLFTGILETGGGGGGLQLVFGFCFGGEATYEQLWMCPF